MRIPALLFVSVLLLAGCAAGNRPMQLASGAGAVYPPNARAAGVEGYVVVRYDVDTEGRVSNVRVVESSPPGVFEESAVQAVSRWRFNPATRRGEPQAVEGMVSRLDFALEGAEEYEEY